jgi:hypothetical protein
MTQHRMGIHSRGIDNLLRDLDLDSKTVAERHPTINILFNYAVGDSPGDSPPAELEAHLLACQLCRSEVDRLKASVSHRDELDTFQRQLRLIVEEGLAAQQKKQTKRRSNIIIVPRDWWLGPRAVVPTALAAAESDITTGSAPGDIIKWAIQKLPVTGTPERFGYRVYIASAVLPANTVVLVGFTDSDIAAHAVSLRPTFDTQVEGKTEFSSDEIARLRPDSHQLRFEIEDM